MLRSPDRPRPAPILPPLPALRRRGLRALLVLLCSVGAELSAGGGEAKGQELRDRERSRASTEASVEASVERDPAGAPAYQAAGAPGPGPPSWARDVALFAGLLGFDRALEGAMEEVRLQRDPFLEDAASTAKTFGNWQSALPVFAGGVALVGGVTEGSDGLKKAAAVLGGVFAGSMANEAVNQLVGRNRPSWGEGAFTFDPLQGHASFPSGHSAFAFSMAGGVDAATDGWLPAAAAYALAGACAASRVYHGRHWVSDVVVGAAVGTVVSRRATRLAMQWLGVGEEERGPHGPEGAAQAGPRPGTTDLLDRVRPVATPQFIGLNIQF